MAYSSNKLSLRDGLIGGRGPRVWEYWNSDTIATVVGAGYITDATKKGMQVGDTVMVYSATLNTTGPDASPSTVAGGQASEFAANPTFTVLSVASISSGAATLLDKQVIGGSASASVALFGGTPNTQRAGSIQVTSNVVTSASFGTLQVAQIQEIQNTLAALGAWKGAA